ncbi:MAG: histidine kinase, partial [Gemmatimonadaceae bacterium]|nr:histidine kinase [Gemmatimonadaceae bacterium]
MANGVTVQVTPGALVGSVAGVLLVTAAVASGIASWLRSRRQLVAARQMLADAQAQAHRLQLQPHFVFNALQAAATLVHRDAMQADLMLVALGDFLRLTMQTAESRDIPLVTELALLDRYVEVMRYRFGDQVRVVVEADPETLDARVPQLLLQPLVENAIRHGLRDGSCRVHVRVNRRGDALLCLVRDHGKGLTPAVRGPGIGLRSTRGRLEALYGSR